MNEWQKWWYLIKLWHRLHLSRRPMTDIELRRALRVLQQMDD